MTRASTVSKYFIVSSLVREDTKEGYPLPKKFGPTNSSLSQQLSQHERKSPVNTEPTGLVGGLDETRTRDPLRDRQVF